jgi:hypothetical protein
MCVCVRIFAWINPTSAEVWWLMLALEAQSAHAQKIHNHYVCMYKMCHLKATQQQSRAKVQKLNQKLAHP